MKHEEEKMINDVFERFISAYAERDKTEDFSNWLASRFQQEMPDMPEEKSRQLSREIIEAVAGYDKTLDNLNQAIDAGQSKEEWLAEQMASAYEDMPLAESGTMLLRVENDLSVANADIVHELTGIPQGEIIDVDVEDADHNEYSVKNTVLNIAKQAVMSGLGAVASIIKQSFENGEPLGSDTINQALQEGIQAASGELKAVVAGAIKIVAEKGLADFLPEDTPLECIGDMACVAVETANALYDAATGKSSVTEALDKIGRASVTAVCRVASYALELKIKTIPKVGPIIAYFAGDLLEHMKSPQFTDGVYNVVREAAITTWDGIKQRAKDLVSMKGQELLTQMVNQ